MRLWIFSDWHLEHHTVPESWVTANGIPEADVCVVPGDMHRGDLEVSFLGSVVSRLMPVVVTPGNHAYYQQSMPDIRAAMREEAARFPDLHLLDPGTVVIDGVRFVGATLWTDYALLGIERRAEAMREAALSMNDHRLILATSAADADGRIWSPDDALQRHEEELAFLRSVLGQPFQGKTVVVTHHGPHPGSIHEQYRGAEHDLLNAAFVSDLGSDIERYEPEIWLHGHIHNTVDHVVANTRITTNPRGYQTRRGAENPVYDPVRVIEI